MYKCGEKTSYSNVEDICENGYTSCKCVTAFILNYSCPLPLGSCVVGFPASEDGSCVVVFPASEDGSCVVVFPASGDGSCVVVFPASGDGSCVVVFPASGGRFLCCWVPCFWRSFLKAHCCVSGAGEGAGGG